MSSCQLIVPVFVNTGKSIGGRSRTLVTRVWNPVRNHCAPTYPHQRGTKKSRLLPVARLRRLLGDSPARRSPRRAARTRAQLGPELVVDGVFRHGSQTCRQSLVAGPPSLSHVPCAVHDVS